MHALSDLSTKAWLALGLGRTVPAVASAAIDSFEQSLQLLPSKPVSSRAAFPRRAHGFENHLCSPNRELLVANAHCSSQDHPVAPAIRIAVCVSPVQPRRPHVVLATWGIASISSTFVRACDLTRDALYCRITISRTDGTLRSKRAPAVAVAYRYPDIALA